MARSQKNQNRKKQMVIATLYAVIVGLLVYFIWPRTLTITSVDANAGMYCDIVATRQACLRDYTYGVESLQFFGAIRQLIDNGAPIPVEGGEIDFDQRYAVIAAETSAILAFFSLHWFKDARIKDLKSIFPKKRR